MDSDFDICQQQLQQYLVAPKDKDGNEIPGWKIPFDTLRFLISKVNYGGRITDDQDITCGDGMLIKYFNSRAVDDEDYFYDEEPENEYLTEQ